MSQWLSGHFNAWPDYLSPNSGVQTLGSLQVVDHNRRLAFKSPEPEHYFQEDWLSVLETTSRLDKSFHENSETNTVGTPTVHFSTTQTHFFFFPLALTHLDVVQ